MAHISSKFTQDAEELFKIGDLLIIETGYPKEVDWEGPVYVLCPFSKKDICQLYQTTLTDENRKRAANGFLSWLLKEGYVEIVPRSFSWYVGDGEFAPE